ncbi:hypothetical protein KY290_005714 [Solanum tuberosum]|uniref:Uncharacterized protein n=1 Tax=Solanum tuberosum TaxID=4113 RepID=A0ABQ7WEX8_SOLTU|nr:hypothetical protein KY284_005776 [Solanum tuberosum]KAH0752459.1 hypothetical protein KY285_005607 [Solanum tuberosum]KAH0779287.1 hypothetical protein KY290_005714 [Solanum tuberosum]
MAMLLLAQKLRAHRNSNSCLWDLSCWRSPRRSFVRLLPAIACGAETGGVEELLVGAAFAGAAGCSRRWLLVVFRRWLLVVFGT